MKYYKTINHEGLDEFKGLLQNIYDWVLISEIGTQTVSGIIINRNGEDPHSEDLLLNRFPRLRYFLDLYNLNCDIAFFLSGGVSRKLKTGLPPHIDGSFENPKVTFVIPLFGCDEQTKTYWVKHDDSLIKKTKDSIKYEFQLLRKFKREDLEVLDSTSIVKPSLLRTNVFHLVENKTKKDRCLVSLRFRDYGVTFEEKESFFDDFP